MPLGTISSWLPVFVSFMTFVAKSDTPALATHRRIRPPLCFQTPPTGA